MDHFEPREPKSNQHAQVLTAAYYQHAKGKLCSCPSSVIWREICLK
jgi:hypothetical protein